MAQSAAGRAPNKRRSGQVNSPPGHYRVPTRGVSVSPLSSPPAGGATPLTPAVPDHTPNARSAGSLVGNVPLDRRSKEGLKAPTPRGKTPRIPKKTPRLSPRGSCSGPVVRKADEEEKRRRVPAEAGDVGNLRRSSSGSRMEGLPDSRATAYPVVKPPMARAGESVTFAASLSGSTTPTDDGVPFTLLSRLRNNPVLQVQDSRIMRLIGKRSVLKAQNGEAQPVRSKARSGGRYTPMEADEKELRAHPKAEVIETHVFPELRRRKEDPTNEASEVQNKVTRHDSPRDCVTESAMIESDPAIIWPELKEAAKEREEEVEELSEDVEKELPELPEPRREDAKSLEEVPVYTPGAGPAAPNDLPLLQNEAGSLVVPQTWRFVQPPPEQAPKPSYPDKVLEAQTEATLPLSREAASLRTQEDATVARDTTPKNLIEELVQDQVKLELRDKQQLVEQLVECLIDQVKRYEKELGAEQRQNRALKMSLEVEQRKALMYHQRLTEMAQHLNAQADRVEA